MVSQFGDYSDQEPVFVIGPMCDGERIDKNLGTSWDSAGGDLTWGAQTNKRTKKNPNITRETIIGNKGPQQSGFVVGTIPGKSPCGRFFFFEWS